jgi:cytochrome c556
MIESGSRRLAIVAVLFGALLVPVQAQVSQGKKRPAKTAFLMRGVTKPHCAAVGDLLKDAGPADDKAWETLACHASILNEMGHGLMDDGRCPDGVWAGATKELREGGAALIAAAEKKDVEGARTGFKTVTASCKSCHDAHKAKK